MILAPNPLLIFLQTSWFDPLANNNNDNSENLFAIDDSNFAAPQNETNEVEFFDAIFQGYNISPFEVRQYLFGGILYSSLIPFHEAVFKLAHSYI